MPATSQAQRRLFAIADKHPDQLYPQNRGLAKLPQQTLHDFAATKESGLPKHVPHMADGGLWWQRETVRGGRVPHMADGDNGHWMADAYKNAGKPGHSLHASLHIPKDEKIPAYRIRKATQSSDPHMRKMAQLVENTRR